MKLTFPLKGKFVGTRAGLQPPGTSRDLNNVRPLFDGRAAGGQRDGLSKRYSQQGAGAAVPIAAITTVTVVV
ncbi:MAG: hypothetical protein ACYS30_24295 [Planctomycetota bacterium]|jgi:hypothetical protein